MRKYILLMLVFLFSTIACAQRRKVSELPTETTLPDSMMVMVVSDSSGTFVNRKAYYINLLSIPGHLLGTTEGSYNSIIGSAFAAKTGYTYCNVVGNNIGNLATGTVHHNSITGSNIANSITIGNVYYNSIIGDSIANTTPGYVDYNSIIGKNIANATAMFVEYNSITGSNIVNAATENIYYNSFVGENIANSITGSISYSFSVGQYNLYNTTNATDLNRVIALPYETFKESSASDLTDAIGIGYRAGYQNQYNSPALFGREATATANKQVVIGSSFYTGGAKVDVDSVKIGSAGTWVQGIGRTAYGDSLFIVVSAAHAGKDTTWLPLK